MSYGVTQIAASFGFMLIGPPLADKGERQAYGRQPVHECLKNGEPVVDCHGVAPILRLAKDQPNGQ